MTAVLCCTQSVANLPLKDLVNHQPYLPWASHVIRFYNLSQCVSPILGNVFFHDSDSQRQVWLNVCYHCW